MIFPHKNCRAISLSCTILAPVMALACLLGTGSLYHARPSSPPAADLASFSALNPIDVHAHVFKNDPAFAALLKRLNLRILDICVVDKHDRGYEEAAPPFRELSQQMVRRLPLK